MTDHQIRLFVEEMERRFAARTPQADPNYWNPHTRVGRSEMVTWARETLGVELSLVDTAEERLARAVRLMWRRLRRRFPGERWT